jgi:hypothetical protein
VTGEERKTNEVSVRGVTGKLKQILSARRSDGRRKKKNEVSVRGVTGK